MIAELFRRIWYLLNRRRFDRELAAEMEAHRAQMADPSRFGSPLRLRDEAGDAWSWNWIDQTMQDLRHGMRVLAKSPSFAIAAVCILAFGIGVNLAFFQMVHVLLLRPPPLKDPYTMVRLYRQSPAMQSSIVPYPATQFYRKNNNALSAVILQRLTELAWNDDASDRIRCMLVSANFFEELGYGAQAGRMFVEAIDERPDAPPSAVISHDFWETRLGRDSSVVGRTIRLNDRPTTIAGVAAAGFPDLDMANPQVWLLMHQAEHYIPGTESLKTFSGEGPAMYARLKPGISPAAAREDLRNAVQELARQRPRDFQKDEWLEPLLATNRFMSAGEREDMRVVLALISALTLLVLLVACSNLSSLVLARANARLREFGVRAALGAGRSRVIRQLVTENLLLAPAGIAGGLILGSAAARIIAVRGGLPSYVDFQPDGMTLLAAVALALAAMAVAGLIPAWRVSRSDLSAAMKDGAMQSGSGMARGRLQKTLIGAQVMGSCVLLIVAGWMVRGLQRLMSSGPGFAFENVAVLDADLNRSAFAAKQRDPSGPTSSGERNRFPKPLRRRSPRTLLSVEA